MGVECSMDVCRENIRKRRWKIRKSFDIHPILLPCCCVESGTFSGDMPFVFSQILEDIDGEFESEGEAEALFIVWLTGYCIVLFY